MAEKVPDYTRGGPRDRNRGHPGVTETEFSPLVPSGRLSLGPLPYTIANRLGCQTILRKMTLPFRDDLLTSLLARCKAMPLSRFSQPLFWLLLLLLAQQCAVLTWRLYELAQPAPLTPWQPSVTSVQGSGGDRLDLGNLSRLSLLARRCNPRRTRRQRRWRRMPRKPSSTPSSTGCWQARIPPSPSPSSPTTGHRTLTASGTTSTVPRPGYARCLPIGSSSPGTAVTRP